MIGKDKGSSKSHEMGESKSMKRKETAREKMVAERYMNQEKKKKEGGVCCCRELSNGSPNNACTQSTDS